MINSIGNNSYPIQPLPADSISPEIQNELKDRAQIKVDEAVATLEAKKDQQWQHLLAQSYVDTQKAVINAYTLSAQGEALYDTNSEKKPSSLTDVYHEALNDYIQDKYEQVGDVKPPINDDLVTTLPMPYEDNVKIQSYMSIQRPIESSLLHLSA